MDRVLRLTGNRRGDNAPQALFELVEKEKPAGPEEEVAPTVAVSEEPEGAAEEEANGQEQEAAEEPAESE